MDIYTIAINFLINLAAGTIGILIVLWIERQRRSSLTMKVGQPHQIKDGDLLNRTPSTWLYVQIHNRNVPKWLSWVYRGEPALACRGWIAFHHLDGHRVFDREMITRWSESDEPKVEIINTEKGQVARLVGAQNTFDIPPGEYTNIDVVFRAKNESEYYGWSNESYLHNWRHPDWQLQKGRYIARIRVKSGGYEYSDAFLIANDVPYEDFRLEALESEIKQKLK